jgi:sulfonate transport system ATP-binding protein
MWKKHCCLRTGVLVMQHGHIAHEVQVELPRPRDLGDVEFTRLRTQLFGWLGVRRA